mmetsp:Transcript_8886/g.10916  ORF Transcript_8886/g.10916 Transcript_8886/m.10916 type:complete len:86 (-) Transcript_8886:494-751(-)
MRPFSEYEAETAAWASTPSTFQYRDPNDFTLYGIFPQQAQTYTKRQLELQTNEYLSVNVTVYLAPGDYFLFNCYGKFVEATACEL